jgi:hypothetical protein
MMFLIGFYYVKDLTTFLYTLRSIFISLMIIIVYFSISNVFQVGSQSYQDDSVFFGESGVNITKSIVIFIVGIPIYTRIETNSKFKSIALVVLVIGVIAVVLGMKRSAILAMVFGFAVYTFLTPYKTRIVKSLPILLFGILLTSPYYMPIIEKRFETRQEKVSMTVDQLQDNESEGRLLEIQYTVEETLESLPRLLFGYNVFLKKDFQGHERMLHVDYMNMLGGAGIIGLVLFLAVYFKVVRQVNTIRLKLKNNLLSREIFATTVALVSVQAFLSFGGTMQGVTQRGYILFYLGIFLGFSVYLYKHKLLQNRENNSSQPSAL